MTERCDVLPPTLAESHVSNLDHTLGGMLRKFERRAPLQDADRRALLDLPFRLRAVEPHQYIVREGMEGEESCMIVRGFAYRQKVSMEGSRQILSVHMAGDFVDLDGSLLRRADHSIQALTRCELAVVPSRAIRALVLEHPNIGLAMWVDTLIDASIFREWLLNIGQRDARARLAHLFCEFSRRLEAAGLCERGGYELPMTQEQLADATGLTSVHVYRTMKSLEREGLIEREKRFVKIPDWERLRDLAGFSELYLHLDQVAI